MSSEVIPVDFPARKRLDNQWLPALTRIAYEPRVLHQPGTLREIGRKITRYPEAAGEPDFRPPADRVVFSRPKSSGGKTVVDIATDLILAVETIRHNGQSDQPGTMLPVQDRNQVLAELTPEQRTQAWETAELIVSAELNRQNAVKG